MFLCKLPFALDQFTQFFKRVVGFPLGTRGVIAAVDGSNLTTCLPDNELIVSSPICDSSELCRSYCSGFHGWS